MMLKALDLAVRFSYMPNSLKFCGPSKCSDIFLNYLENKTNPEQVKEALQKFEGLMPYLSFIAEKTGKNPLSYEVIEAYWIGNDLLDQFNDDDMKHMINILGSRGLPKSLTDSLINELPSGFFPHHNFNVFYVGVGRITDSVETSLNNMNNCMTNFGKVVDSGSKLIVQTQEVVKEDKFEFKATTKVAVKFDFDKFKNGDLVALHWGLACRKLSQEEADTLQRYNNKLLKIMNTLSCKP